MSMPTSQEIITSQNREIAFLKERVVDLAQQAKYRRLECLRIAQKWIVDSDAVGVNVVDAAAEFAKFVEDGV